MLNNCYSTLMSVTRIVPKIKFRSFNKMLERLGIKFKKRILQFETGKAISNFIEEFHHLHPSVNGILFEYLVFAINKFQNLGEEIFEVILNEISESIQISPDYFRGVSGFSEKKQMIEEIKKISSRYIGDDWKYQYKMCKRSIVGIFDFLTPDSIVEIKVSKSSFKNIIQLITYSAINGMRNKLIMINFMDCEIWEIDVEWDDKTKNNYLDWLLK